MFVTIIGTGEAFDSCFGNSSCLVQGDGLSNILVDCGYQIPERLFRAPKLCAKIDAVWLTHFHADHAFGLAPLLVSYWEEGRKRPFSILGGYGLRAFVEKLLDAAYPSMRVKLGFDLKFEEFANGESRQFDGYLIRCAESKHSVPNLSVRFEDPRNKSSVGISGDGALSHHTQELFQDVDLLLHEVFERYPSVPVHTNLNQLRHYVNGQGSNIGSIGVTHVSRFFRDEVKRGVLELNQLDPRWFIVEPEMVLEPTPARTRFRAAG